MSLTNTIQRISQFVQNELIVSDDVTIKHDEDLLSGGHIDSMGIMRLVTYLESEFDVSVPPQDVTIENFLSIQTISCYVDRQTCGN